MCDSRFFRMSAERGNPELIRGMKIFKKGFNGNKTRYVFSHRVVDRWNELQRDEVEAGTTSTFKARYDIREADRREARMGDIYEY